MRVVDLNSASGGGIANWRWGRLSFPDLLSLARLPLAVVMIAVVARGELQKALFVVIVMGLTDFFDGFLARAYGIANARGARLDEVCDKISISIVLAYFTIVGSFPWPALALFLLREVAVTIYRYRVRRHFPHADLAAKMAGKVKTTLQFVIVGVLVMPQLPHHSELLMGLVTMMLVVSYASGMNIMFSTNYRW